MGRSVIINLIVDPGVFSIQRAVSSFLFPPIGKAESTAFLSSNEGEFLL
jgi:hypothetical protein